MGQFARRPACRPDAAARFVAAVRLLAPKSKIIPVWMTECEEQDREKLCAGVGCFAGACWREWIAQLMPLAEEAETIAVLATWRALSATPAGWIAPWRHSRGCRRGEAGGQWKRAG